MALKSKFLFWLALSLLAANISACKSGPRAVRGSDTPGLDNAPMSTTLDRKDLQQALRVTMDAMKTSSIMKRWSEESRPAVGVLPIRNETSEHIESALGALLTEVESQLLNFAPVRVVSLESQPELMAEITRQQQSNGAFDQTQIARWGKQLGVRYIITGKVYTTDERTQDARRVQYYLFMRVLSVETGELLFQNQAPITKAII